MAVLLISLCASCTTPPPVVKSLPPQEVLERHQSTLLGFSERLERQVKKDRDPEAEEWICRMVERLSASLKDRVFLPRECSLIQAVASQWRSFSIPYGGLYLSTDVLRGVRLEAEVAAVIALELANLDRGLLIRKLEASLVLKQSAFEVFEFSEDERLESVGTAVDLLYQTGYDPRALVSLLQFFDKNRKFAPYTPELIGKLLEKARRTIALRAPLSNPILRSAEFARVQKGIRKL